MSVHKLLEKQIRKYLPQELTENPALENFINAINESYISHERDRELLTHAFNITEIEYQDVNSSLLREYELKKLSIEKLKQAVKNSSYLFESQPEKENDDLLVIADYISTQISERKIVEKELNRTVNLLTVLLTNLESGVLAEDENHKILFANELFCNLFKISESPETLWGQECLESSCQDKNLFKDPSAFEKRLKEILSERKKVVSEELELANGEYLERDFIPINIHNNYKGHLWRYTNITERKKNENNLRHLNNTQDAILNGTNYSIIFTDINGTIKSFNKGAEIMLGYTADEMIDMQSPSLFHCQEEVIKRAEELSIEQDCKVEPGFDVFKLNPKKGIVETREWMYITKEGHQLPVLLTVSAIKNVAEEITGYLGIARDISEKKYAREALKISEEKYRNILEKSTDIIYKSNMAGYFTYVNPVAERITEYSNGELLNMHFSELIREDYKKEAKSFYRQQAIEKKPTTYLEFPIITKSGKEKWIGQSVQYTALDAISFELTSLAMDITERKMHEKTIKLQDEKYRNIIANMNMGIVEVDMGEIIRYCNQSFCDACGYTINELVGKSLIDVLMSEESRNTVKNKMMQRLAGLSDIYEIEIKTKKNETRWWMVSGAPNYDEAGNQIGSIGINVDVTERKMLEQELKISKQKAEESSKAKEAFLSNMSHEIRTPLNAIIGMIRELSYEDLSPTQKMYLQNTSTSSQHLYSILNNILDIAKIDAGEFDLDVQNFSLNKIFNDVIAIMGNKANEKNIFLSTHVAKEVKKGFVGDPIRIKQILINLVGNAIKFTEKGGITIKCDLEKETETEQSLNISIIDTGIGMDEDFVKKIFSKFSQEDASISRKYGGTGLGMSITQELIILMKGTIDVQSKKNSGTSISIKLTFPIGEEPKEIKEISFTEQRKNRDKIKILLAEDNEFNRLVATRSLDRYNCIVTEVVNGAEAVEILKKESFDLILMDLQMPVLGGIEATKIIRNELKIEIPIIALTANAFQNSIEQCLKIGMNDCVTKPFDEKLLVDSVFKNVELHKTRLTIKTEKLYNLTKLKELARGDSTYLKKVIHLFIQQATSSIILIKDAMLIQDLETVTKIAHKIRPSINSLNIESLKDEIREMELEAGKGKYSERLEQLVSHTDRVLMQVIEGLKTEA